MFILLLIAIVVLAILAPKYGVDSRDWKPTPPLQTPSRRKEPESEVRD